MYQLSFPAWKGFSEVMLFSKVETSCKSSRGAVHVGLLLRWSVNQLLVCLYKDNLTLPVLWL